MKNPKIFFHIGLPKTGTTSIQYFLTHNRRALLDSFGILYPESCVEYSDGAELHRPIRKAIMPRNPYEGLEKNTYSEFDISNQLQNEITKKNPNTIIFSDEDMYSLHNPGILKKFFEKYDLKIIIYLRQKVKLVESMYEQQIMDSLYSKDFFHFVDDLKNDSNKFSQALDFELIINKWSNCFGSDNLIIKKYINEDSFDSVSDFLQIFEFQNNAFKIDKKLNVRKNNRQIIEIKRQLNILIGSGEFNRILIADMFLCISKLNYKNIYKDSRIIFQNCIYESLKKITSYSDFELTIFEENIEGPEFDLSKYSFSESEAYINYMTAFLISNLLDKFNYMSRNFNLKEKFISDAFFYNKVDWFFRETDESKLHNELYFLDYYFSRVISWYSTLMKISTIDELEIYRDSPENIISNIDIIKNRLTAFSLDLDDLRNTILKNHE